MATLAIIAVIAGVLCGNILAQSGLIHDGKHITWYNGNGCRNSNHHPGYCTSFAQCFRDSLTRVPNIAEYNAGQYDACAFPKPNGPSFVGVCCTARYPQPVIPGPGWPFVIWTTPKNPTVTPTKPTIATTTAKPHPLTTKKPTIATQRPQITYPTNPPEDDIIDNGFPQPACGHQRGDFHVVGGKVAGYFPWVASLHIRNRHFCGGTLIGPYHVLTAAHCVRDYQPEDLVVRLGDHNLTDPSDYTHMNMKVAAITVHPNYNSRFTHNDAAILRLASKAPHTDYIQPICLPDIQDGDLAGEAVKVIGWGATRFRGRSSTILMENDFTVWSVADCKKRFQRSFPNQITETNICAGGTQNDACNGDSGGPLMYRKKNSYAVVGIVSWGVGCGQFHYPGVYTRVTSFLTWIRGNMSF